MAPCSKCCKKRCDRNNLQVQFKNLKSKSTNNTAWKINTKGIFKHLGNIGKYVTEKLAGNVPAVDDKITFEEKAKIYLKVMEHPSLHKYDYDVSLTSCNFDTTQKKTARHYAANLWNAKLMKTVRFHHDYTQRNLLLTIKYMSQEDMDVMEILIKKNFSSILNGYAEITKDFLRAYILTHPSRKTLIMDVLQNWLLLMPILQQLAKITGWKFLKDSKACLLDIDALYSIFLNMVYKTPQPPKLSAVN